MGRRRVNVGTSVIRLIDDDQLPDATKSGVIRSIFQDGNLTEYVLEELITSIGVRAENMYRYGRDHYIHGLPSGQFMTAGEDANDVMSTVLLGIEDAPVEIDYLRYGPPNNLHIGWMALLASHGYDPATNQLAGLTATKGTPVYLEDMLVVVPMSELATIEPRSLEQWGIAARAGYTPQRVSGTAETRAMIQPSSVRGDEASTTEYLRVEYVWEDGGIQKDFFTIPITGFDDNAEYFHVRYRVGGVANYWMYKDGAGVYPALDALFDTGPEVNGQFFPFAYFRYNKSSEISNPTSPAYLTTKKMVKYLGIDYDQVAESINSNPDIDDVDNAMLMLAVPANTTNELERRYLFEFFDNLYQASSPEFRYRTEEQAILAAFDGIQANIVAPAIVIQDSRFKMSLDNRGIYKRRKAGSIGAVGTHGSSTSTRLITFPIIVDGETPYASESSLEITSHYYRRQVSLNYYDEIQVVELRTLFNIFEGYNSIGDDDDTILIIPLDHSITSQFSIPDREVLYARSLHMVFNSLIVTRVKWYETGLFRFVLLVVAIFITIYSWGADGGSAIAAALAAGSYLLAAQLIFVMLLEFILYRIAFKLFVKAVGVEAAFVILILAAAFGVMGVMQSGSVGASPYAGTLLMLASGISTGIGDQLKSDMEDLIGEREEFDLLSKEKNKELEAAQKLLENDSILSPFVIFGEKPQDFYNRTVHSGNIGVVSLDAIEYYVDFALRLPDLKDSQESFK